MGHAPVVIVGGSVATATTNSSVMLLNGANVIGSVTVLQGTNPFIITGSIQGGGAGAVDLGAMPKVPDIDTGGLDRFKGKLDSMSEGFKTFFARFREINFQPLMDSLGKLKTALEPVTATLFEGLTWAWDNVLAPLATWTIQDALPSFFKALAGAATILNPLLLSFKPLGKWLWENFLQPIATWTGGVIVSVLNGLANELTFIGNWMSDHQSIVDGITTSVVLFFAAWKGIELLAFIQMSGGVMEALKGITAAVKAATIAKLADKWETMALTAMYAKDLIVSVVKSTAAFLKQAWQIGISTIAIGAQTIAAGAYAFATGIATAATWFFNAALAVLTSPITLVIGAIALLGLGIYMLVKHWDEVKEAGAKAWKWIKEKWDGAATWFGDKVATPIKNAFSGMWDGVKNIFKAGANVAITALESFVNFAIKGFNKVIYGWNLAKSAMGISGWTMPIADISIPRLANGGIVSSPTLAMVGDNRNAGQDPEVISPLSKLQGMLGGGSEEMVAILKLILAAIQSQSMSLKIGESEFARLIASCINSEQRRTGKALIEV